MRPDPGRSKEAVLKAGGSGILSLPRVLSLGEDGQIEMEPVAEVNALRGKGQVASNVRVAPGAGRPLPDVKDDALDIVTEFDPGSAARLGLKGLRSPGGQEETIMYYDHKESEGVKKLITGRLYTG